LGSRFPRRGSHPPKNSPRRQPHRVTAAVAPLSFHSQSDLPADRPALHRAPRAGTGRMPAARRLNRPPEGVLLGTKPCVLPRFQIRPAPATRGSPALARTSAVEARPLRRGPGRRARHDHE
jgi:hypothetical protein